ncbi:MAG: PhzF family phenazine biosynthesis protein [Rhizobiales bacterium]|nr:PhzF family phenazine biosynthesis protein [Hyphomicrobiales bacterium]
MQVRFHTLDVFTMYRFGGNPLAVVLDADELTDEQMLKIAREFNLSETIFACRPKDKANSASVRIFFPTGEMPFAGHPTVGCAVLLAELKNKATCSFQTEIRLEEVAGLVPVTVTRIADRIQAMFTAPVVPYPVDIKLPPKPKVAQALGIEPAEIGFDGHKLGVYEGGPRFFYVPVASRDILAKCRVIEPMWTDVTQAMGVDNAYVYARGGDDPRTAFRGRMFAPAAGIPEDPATGSATALLAAQLLQAESLADGRHVWELEQGYEMGRPSELHLEADVIAGRLAAVRVAGSAVRVSEGILTLD